MRSALQAVALAVVIAAWAAPAVPSAAEAVAIVSPTGSGVAPAEVAAAVERFRVEIERTGRFVAVPVASPARPGEEPSPAQAAQAARAAGASLAAVLRLARLGPAAVARVAVYRADGTVAFVRSAEVAPGEPIDAAVARLGAAFADAPRAGAPPRETAPPPPPWSPASAAPPAAIPPAPPPAAAPAPPAQSSVPPGLQGAFRGGAVFPRDRASTDARAPVFAGFGLAPWLEAGPLLVDFTFDVFLSDLAQDSRRDYLVALGTDALFPLGRGPVYPYLGAGVGYAWYRFGGSGADGALLRLPAGVIFHGDRRHDASARLEVAWFTTGDSERDLVTGELRRPWGWTLTLAIGGR